MMQKYYQQELANLRELAAEFSKAHPALAPMLSGPTRDPDVERLLEGSAFLTGLLRSKLDDEFPELIHGLVQLLFPHALRPVPSATIMVFAPKPGLREELLVPAGTAVASIPVDGTKCQFMTCYDVTVAPLKITAAQVQERNATTAVIRLAFELQGQTLATWRPRSLRLYLGGQFIEATSLYAALLRKVRSVTVKSPADGKPLVLPASCLKPGGFGDREHLSPYPSQSFPGFRVLQEYFALPEKFLFIDVTGLENWNAPGKGNSFEILMEVEAAPGTLPRVGLEHFHLFATPAVNVFAHDALPIRLDHRVPEYLVRPEGTPIEHYQVFLVETVTGIEQGTARTRDYVSFESVRPQDAGSPIYNAKRRISPVYGGQQVSLELTFPAGMPFPQNETLATRLLCTNAQLPERLQLGDIREATSTSPDLCSFRNIRQPTCQIEPPLGKDSLWRLLSHLTLNLLSMGDAQGLRTLLGLYIFPEGRDRTAIEANKKRIEGIAEMTSRPADRLLGGQVVHGREIAVKLNPEGFPGGGDMFLFGSILDYFLGSYASINSFTQLTSIDAFKGDVHRWPARAGERFLL